MAEQKAKAKGKKIGRWQRKPTNVRYKSENRRDANKRRRMEKQLAEMGKRMDSKTFPGWDYREGYGLVRV